MKTIFSFFFSIVLLSCNDSSQSYNADMDSTKTLNADTVPTGNSSSPSEFNKGNSSPTGSTGGVDSTAAAGAAADKTGTDLDNRHPEIDKMKDSSGKNKN